MFYMLFFVLFLIGRLNRNRNFSLKTIGIGAQKSISDGPYTGAAAMLDAVGEDAAGGSTEASSSSSQTWSVRQALSGERW